MLCPNCETDVEIERSGQVVCHDCGKTWPNALIVFGEKRTAIIARLEGMTITKNSDCLGLIHELTNLDAAYAEIVDELTMGAQI